MKTTIITIISVLILIFTITAALTGCGSSRTGNTGSSIAAVNTTNLPVFEDEDGQALQSAYTDYENLVQNSTPTAAREELVQQLNENLLADAYLGDDGTSIFSL